MEIEKLADEIGARVLRVPDCPVAEVLVTGATLRAQHVRAGDLFAAGFLSARCRGRRSTTSVRSCFRPAAVME